MGNSNGPESKFNTLRRFREKGSHLEAGSYACQTGCGLLQGNRVAALMLGLQHWELRVLTLAGLPVSPVMVKQVRARAEAQGRAHQERRTTVARRRRVKAKKWRGAEHQLRKLNVPKHSYDSDRLEQAELDDPTDGYGADLEDEDTAFGAGQVTTPDEDGMDLQLGTTDEDGEPVVTGRRRQAGFGAADAMAGEERRDLLDEMLAEQEGLQDQQEVDGTEVESAPPAQPALAAGWISGKDKLDEFVLLAGKKVLAVPYDLECSGLSNYLDSIIELAAQARLVKIPLAAAAAQGAPATWAELQGIAPFGSRVHTLEKLTPGIMALTSITQADVAAGTAPDFSTMWASFCEWLRGAVTAASADVVMLVAHNGDTYDFPMMVENGTTHGVDVGADLAGLGVTAVADSMKWSRDLADWAEGERPLRMNKHGVLVPCDKQQQVFEALGLGSYLAHTAPGDVGALCQIGAAGPFAAGLALHSDIAAVSLEQHRRRQAGLKASWLRREGGYTRVERPVCDCNVAMFSGVTAAGGRQFRCQRAVPRGGTGGTWRPGDGYAVWWLAQGPAYKPGFPPPAPKRPQADNGAVGACTCKASCGTAACPCFARWKATPECRRTATHDCVDGCHPRAAGAKGSRAGKCRHSAAGRALKLQVAAAKATKPKVAETASECQPCAPQCGGVDSAVVEGRGGQK